jgi:transposase
MTDILDLKGWTVHSKTQCGGEYVIDAEYTIQPANCPKCGVVDTPYKHGVKPIKYRDSPIRGSAVVILANVQRYRCKHCKETFLQPLGGIQSDMRMTQRCVEYIQTQCLRDTFVRIAEHIGCDDKTVRALAADYIAAMNTRYKAWLPEWLGIDETQIDGQLRCIITDVKNRVPIDMLPTRDKDAVTTWLNQFRNKRTVKGLAIDMWRPYKDAAQLVFPGLPVVIDKFHVVKMANKALEDVRITLAKDQTKAVGKDWMRRKALLRMRFKNLDEKGRFGLGMWLDNEPAIKVAYDLKEAFYDIYDAPTKKEAGARLDAWRDSVPVTMKKGKKSFAPLLTATKNWRNEILAFFDHPISNGYTEALNGVAKVINRQGRGYSFEVLRARLLFSKIPKVTEIKEVEVTEVEMPETETIQIVSRNPARTVRHMLLYKYQNRCQSCLGVYDPSELYVTRMGVVLEDEPMKNRTLMCAPCKERFHTEGATHHDSTSTP